jgi:ribosomal protein L16/L10AE
MSESAFYIQAVVDDVAVGFYVESSSHTEASNEALRTAERRFPGKRVVIQVVEKLRSSNPSESQSF